ncbi:serine/threonine protein kinase [Haliangium sp.]|uniref:serine/threonine protein kinase n=1 Tax=Haliangium sp. TaxID=2663208 RepID=UPI003D0BE0C8
MPRSSDPSIDPELVERLQVRQTLGRGGMGTIRLAKQPALGRAVAAKTVRPSKLCPATTAELWREAWVTGSLEHPNVVPVYDMEVDQHGTPVILFRHIDGATWGALMHDAARVAERFSARDLLEWNLRTMLQVLDAVRFAHSRGIVHRDLKPDNVMIGRYGEVYVLDWGIAVSLRDDGSGRLPLAAEATDMAGTPAYMAPEMLGGGDPQISERTDIYLLGAILYEILTGAPPHDKGSRLEIIASVVESCPPLPDDLPPGLVQICRTAMDPEPERRYPSAEAMRQALLDFLQHRGSERLAGRARQRYVELQRVLARGPADLAEHEHRQQLYKLYGACRFGFLEALSTWAENTQAQRGLRDATETMIAYELAHGSARAAMALVADVEPSVTISRALRRRIEDALQAREVDSRRLSELEALGRANDPRVGTRVRALLVAIVGLTWVLSPIATALSTGATLDAPGHPAMMGYSVFAAIEFALLVLVFRRSLLTSLVNRRLCAVTTAMLLAQGLLYLGAELLGVLPAVAQCFHIFLWMCVVTIMALAIERRLWPAAVGMLLAFLLSAHWPGLRMWMRAGANTLLLANALMIWLPRGCGSAPTQSDQLPSSSP